MMSRLKIFLEMIKFEHTLFALPFAYLGYAFAAGGDFRWAEIFWVTAAMVAARTAGMCLNRIIDRRIDALNPRTRGRALVTGAFRLSWTWIIAALSLTAFVFSAYQLNTLCFQLAPIALFLLVIYHYLKRWTWLCHFGIGLVLAVAPVGGWMARTASWEMAQIALGAAVLFWVAGFDIFYSLQDMEFDRANGLRSIAARFGEAPALRVAGICHFLTVFFLIQVGIMMRLSWIYWTGLALCILILLAEHHLVRRGGKERLEFVFFAMNGTLSAFFFIMATVSLVI